MHNNGGTKSPSNKGHGTNNSSIMNDVITN
jgi:hypothetical protein